MTSQTIEIRLHLDDIAAPLAVLGSSSCVLASPSAEDSAAGGVMAVVLPVAQPAQACE